MHRVATSGLATDSEHNYKHIYNLYVLLEKNHANVAYNFHIR